MSHGARPSRAAPPRRSASVFDDFSTRLRLFSRCSAQRPKHLPDGGGRPDLILTQRCDLPRVVHLLSSWRDCWEPELLPNITQFIVESEANTRIGTSRIVIASTAIATYLPGNSLPRREISFVLFAFLLRSTRSRGGLSVVQRRDVREFSVIDYVRSDDAARK